LRGWRPLAIRDLITFAMSDDSTKVALPYLASPGSIKKALEKIKVAATPPRVTQDFVATKLQMKGGVGAALIPYLKKIGFVAPDGAPTHIYKRFRNSATAGSAAAEAVKVGYAALGEQNEYFHELDDNGLAALVTQVTGAAQGDNVAKLICSTLKNLKSFADFDAESPPSVEQNGEGDSGGDSQGGGRGDGMDRVKLGLSCTINLNLPATSDQAVFNAIFKSIKEHLLSNDE
jgi:hypothetical protein